MLPDERLADYFAGVLSPEESAAVEAEILVNRDSLRELCVQQQVDAAPLNDHDRAVLAGQLNQAKQAVTATAAAPSNGTTGRSLSSSNTRWASGRRRPPLRS